MEQRQETRVLSVEKAILMAKMQEVLRSMESADGQQLHDLTLLRIERNRAARHERCATMRK